MRDDGRLVEDDALAARVDERVRGAEVDREVAGQGELLRPSPRRTGVARRVPQSEPPSQCSRFQIGTVSLSVSMQNRAASKASARCGDDTTTATDASESSRSPMRCSSATRSIDRPAPAGLGGDRGQLGDGLLLVGLVGEAAHAVATVGVVAHDAEEHDDRAAAGRGGPGGGGVDRQRVAGDGDPVAGGGRLHGAMVVKAASRAPCGPAPRPAAETPVGATRKRAGPVGTLRAMSPEEAGGDGAPEPDDPPSGPPPDPLDRPWVHPSELQLVRRDPGRAGPRDPAPRVGDRHRRRRSPAVLATVLVLVAFGALGGRHRSPLPPPVVTNPGDVVDYAVAERVGAAVAPSVVTVRAGRRRPPSRSVRASCSSPTASSPPRTSSTAPPRSTVVDDHRRRRSPAKVVGTDPQTDLALLAVSGGDLQLADARARRHRRASARPSSRSTATRGSHYRVGINVVSDRDVMVDAGTGIDVAGLLETGIPVTPDMAGGALVDPDGNLVGILTRAATGGPDGLAIPVADGARRARTSSTRQRQGHPRLARRAVRPGRRRRRTGRAAHGSHGRDRGQPGGEGRARSRATSSCGPSGSAGERPARPGRRGAHACGPRTRSTSSTCVTGRTRNVTVDARRRRPAGRSPYVPAMG